MADAEEYMESSQLRALTGFGVAMGNVATAGVGVVGAAVSLLSAIVSALPVIVIALAITAVMMPWVRYHDRAIETAEFAMRNTVYPIYRDVVRDILSLVRQVYNPVACWWNAANWWGYGIAREVIWPTVRDCGVRNLFVKVPPFIKAVALDIVVFIAQGRFQTEFADFSRITPAGIDLFQAWVDLYTCACMDLSEIVKAIPLVNPLLAVPVAYPVMAVLSLFSGQWLDPQTWCALEHLFNAGVALVRVLLELIIQIIYLLFNQSLPAGETFVRPDFRIFVEKLCQAIECGMRSIENAYQVFWDQYIPFQFVFAEYLCVVDTLACIALKSIDLVLRLLINIDRAVQYPADPFWESVIKADVIEIMNLYVAPTNFAAVVVPGGSNPTQFVISNYYLDTGAEATPLGEPNPVYGKRRLVDCICIFIQRTICDPSDTNTGCFSQGAANLLMGLDFCCLTNELLVLFADIASFLLEFTFHFSHGPDNFFLYIDDQPFTTIIKDDLVRLVRCAISIFGIIPVVGTCIRDLITGIVQYLLCLVDFVVRLVIGLVTLPYFLIVMPTIPNFLTKSNEAVEFFVQIHEDLIADTPSSVKNCLCAILNNGFPIPPVPCPECEVGGFVPPPAFKKRSRRRMYDPETGELQSPLDMAAEVWDVPTATASGLEGAARHLTPLLKYDNHTTNPIALYNMLWVNVETMDPRGLPFPTLKSMNDYVDIKHQELFERWNRVKACNAKADAGVAMKQRNPALYEYRKRRGEFTCDAGATAPGGLSMPPYQPPSSAATISVDDDEYLVYSSSISSNATDAHHHHHLDERLTLGPVEPTVVGCSNPKPRCFDLCCIVRSTLIFLVHLIQLIARFFNGLIQGSAAQQGTVGDFPYFTGEFANFGKPTFESDFITVVLDLFVPIRCACQVLNLVIPVVATDPSSPTQGRPDICCFVQRVSELIACILQVIINAINSLAMGAQTDFIYFKGGHFKNDVNVLFDVTLEVVVCLCIFVRAIFPLNFIPGFAAATNFDICCAPQAILVTVIEIARAILQIVISLATITIDESSYCYWRLDYTWDGTSGHQCGGSLDKVGIIVQTDVIIDSFLPSHDQNNGGACMKTCGYENGNNGIAPCLCQILNTLVPWRQFPDKAASCDPDPAKTNCQMIDVCCPIVKIGYFLNDSLKMINRLLVSLWQSWEGGLPEFFINYVWCSEGTLPPCPDMQIVAPTACSKAGARKIPVCQGTWPVLDSNNVVQYRCGEFTCGKVNIIIADITDPFDGLLSRCTCVVFSLLDQLIALIFNLIKTSLGFGFGWSCCFCGGYDPNTEQCNVLNTNTCTVPPQFTGSGVLPAISYIAQAVLVAVTNLLRQFPLSCYWRPAAPMTPSEIDETWIFSFLGPTSNALCIAVGNLACFAQNMFWLPQICMPRAQKTLGSSVRWVFEVVFRVIGFIEAFILQYVNSDMDGAANMSTCVGETCDQAPGSKEQVASVGGGPGVSAKPLGNMLIILLSIPIDLLIGDGGIACTTICPKQTAVPTPAPCGCWDRSPMYGNDASMPSYTLVTGVGHPSCADPANTTHYVHVGEQFGVPDRCCMVTDPVRTPKLTRPMPVCQNPNDYDDDPSLPVSGFPGSCGYLSACRPDALPSCADDPMTPIGLSANYAGAVDGIVLGLTRYLMCLLNNLLPPGCGGTIPCTELGAIFYPALLIFSLMWQILGGVIRFIASTLIFFFSLFNPPSGSPCTCWHSAVVDGYGNSGTRYYRLVGALCYPCFTVGFDCNVVHQVGPSTQCAFINPCQEYCPSEQQRRNPTWTKAQADQACVDGYSNYTHMDLFLSPAQACSGHTPARTGVQGLDTSSSCTFTQPAVTTTSSGSGLCAPTAGCSTPWQYYLQLDACPDPHCQYNPPANNHCGQSVTGHWPCGGGGSFFDASYPDGPLVTCGALQIVSNFLDIFSAFVQIFTTPLIIPDISGQKRDVITTPLSGDRRRFDGLLYGMSTGEPNFMEKIVAAVYEYDARDCYDDPVKCACRNLDMREHCHIDLNGDVVFNEAGRRKRNGHNMTATDLTQMVADEMFLGDNVCDHVIRDCAGMNWTEIPHADKNQWVKCFERYIQGSRMHTVADVVPMDMMYNPHAPVQLMHNMFHTTRANLGRKRRLASGPAGSVPAIQARWRLPDPRYRRPPTEGGSFWNRLVGSRAGRYEGPLPPPPPSPLPVAEGASARGDPPKTYRQQFEERFPRLREQLHNRSLVARETLTNKYGIRPQDLMFDAMIKADAIWYKYQLGMYGYAVEKTAEAISRGLPIFPTTDVALQDLHHAAQDLKRIVTTHPYHKIGRATMEAASTLSQFVRHVTDQGVGTFLGRTYEQMVKTRQAKHGEHHRKRAEEFAANAAQWPIVKWWNQSQAFEPRNQKRTGQQEKDTMLGPFVRHMTRTIAFQRRHWQNATFNFWNADLKLWSLSDIFVRRWKNPRYTPEQTENWRRIQSVYYRLYDKIWPNQLPLEVQQRFNFFSNCVILDRATDLTVKVVDYCANAALPNVRGFLNETAAAEEKARRQRGDTNATTTNVYDDDAHSIGRYFVNTSPYRNGTYYGWKNRPRFVEQRTVSTDPDSWIRPRILVPNATRPLRYDVDRRVYRRQVTMNNRGPAGFNLFDWVVVVIEDVFEFALGAQTDTWFDEIRMWISNPNTDVSAWPDVGLMYWVRFPFVCNFPENTNCSIGAGLEQALLWVTVGFVAMFLVSAYIFPLITIPFQIIGFGLSYWFVFAAVAWHMPPACMLLTPSFPLGVGVTVPECALDQVIAFADKWITNCYTPLLIPAYMVSGPVCPTDPNEYIDVLNCRDVGVSDGLQNLLYLGFWLFGSAFSNLVTDVTSIVLGNFWPAAEQYVITTLADFKSASPTHMERLTACFYLTLPSIILPLVFVFLMGLVGALILPPLVALIQSIAEAVMASPASVVVPGGDAEQWLGSDAVEGPIFDADDGGDANTTAAEDAIDLIDDGDFAAYGGRGSIQQRMNQFLFGGGAAAAAAAGNRQTRWASATGGDKFKLE